MLHDLEPVDIEALLPVCCRRECVLPNGFLQVGHWSFIGKKLLFKIDKCVSGKKGWSQFIVSTLPHHKDELRLIREERAHMAG